MPWKDPAACPLGLRKVKRTSAYNGARDVAARVADELRHEGYAPGWDRDTTARITAAQAGVPVD